MFNIHISLCVLSWLRRYHDLRTHIFIEHIYVTDNKKNTPSKNSVEDSNVTETIIDQDFSGKAISLYKCLDPIFKLVYYVDI